MTSLKEALPPELLAEWKRFYVHAAGESVAVHENGEIGLESPGASSLLGLYRLENLDSSDFRDAALEEWEARDITPRAAERIFAEIEAHRQTVSSAPLTQTISDAHLACLYEAHKRIREHHFTNPGLLPRLWIVPTTGVEAVLKQNVITLSLSTPIASLQAALDAQWEHVQLDGNEAMGEKNSALDIALPLPRHKEDNKGSGITRPTRGGGVKQNTNGQIWANQRLPRAVQDSNILMILQEADVSPITFGSLMRFLRVTRGFSQDDMFEKTGFRGHSVQQLEGEHAGDAPAYLERVLSDNVLQLPVNENGAVEGWVQELLTCKLAEHQKGKKTGCDNTHRHLIDNDRLGKEAQDVRLLAQLNEARADNISFAELARSLRVIRGLSKKRLAERMMVPESTVHTAEKTAGVEGWLCHAERILHESNPLALPVTVQGDIEPWIAKLLRQKARVNPKSSELPYHDVITLRGGAALEEAELAMKRYMRGQADVTELPGVSQILSLAQPTLKGQNFFHGPVAQDMLGKTPTVKDIQRLNYIVLGRSTGTDKEIEKIADLMGISGHLPLLLRLPREPKRFFAEAVRLEMTQPTVQRLLDHPEQCESAGAWLKALRQARQLSPRVVGETLGIPVHQVTCHESCESLQSSVIEKYNSANPFDLNSEQRQKFRALLSGKQAFHHSVVWLGWNNLLPLLGVDVGDRAVRPKIHALVQSILDQTQGEPESEHVFEIDGTPCRARRDFRGELRIAPEAVQVLRHCPSIQALQSASPLRLAGQAL